MAFYYLIFNSCCCSAACMRASPLAWELCNRFAFRVRTLIIRRVTAWHRVQLQLWCRPTGSTCHMCTLFTPSAVRVRGSGNQRKAAWGGNRPQDNSREVSVNSQQRGCLSPTANPLVGLRLSQDSAEARAAHSTCWRAQTSFDG